MEKARPRVSGHMATPFRPSRRQALQSGCLLAGSLLLPPWVRGRGTAGPRDFDVRDFGATGDGATPDTAAIQRALDTAAAAGRGSRVLVPGGRCHLIGGLRLPGGIDFHLADDAELLVSTDPRDFPEGTALEARDAVGLRLTGTGRLNGRAHAFMAAYEEEIEWWRPGPFRPRLAVLTGCRDLEVRDLSFVDAPVWTLHLVSCQGVRVDRVRIRNPLDVPNCDGIDPDHCRDVEISNCDITCGDDPLVIKATRAGAAFGGCENISIRDCVVETRSAGLKIGTETVAAIRRIRFERCEVRSACRGISLQLRDEGAIEDVAFRDIRLVARHHPRPWWGLGEAISVTAHPRQAGSVPGVIRGLRFSGITARAENSFRLSGSPASRLRDIRVEGLDLTLGHWTPHPGGTWDNRPTSVLPEFETRPIPAIHVRHADGVVFDDCQVGWQAPPADHFSHALEAVDATGLDFAGLRGESAHPGRIARVRIGR